MLYYIVAVNIYMTLLYGFYKMLLQNSTLHHWGRVYLLAAVFLACLLPFIRMQLDFDLPIQHGATWENTVQHFGELPPVVIAPEHNLAINGTVIIYIVVVTLLVVLLLVRLLRLYRFLRGQDYIPCQDVLVALNTERGPAGFFNRILFPGAVADETIIAHESAHYALKHTYDKLFMAFAHCFLFAVVPFYFIRKELFLIHEFQADAISKNKHTDYPALLLQAHFSTLPMRSPLFNNLHVHSLKRRIMMMQKNKTGQAARCSGILLLSLGFTVLTIVLQSRQAVHAQNKQEKTTDTKEQNSAPGKTQNNTVAPIAPVAPHAPVAPAAPLSPASPVVPIPPPPAPSVPVPPPVPDQSGQQFDSRPKPPYDLREYLINNLHYPPQAVKDSVEGSVLVKFMVNEDGSISDVKPTKQLPGGLSEEAVRVVKNMPPWIPGMREGEKIKAHFSIPVIFRLDAVHKE